jgi:peptidoglycan/LPS O-acetylase OafA/YrhL
VIGAATRVYAGRLVVPRWAAGAALSGLALLSVVPLRGHALTYLAGGPTIAALTAVVLLAWRDRTEVSGRAARALVWLGTVSYAAYLWNYPLTIWLRPQLGDAAGVVAVALTLVAAALSWRLVEGPLQRRWARPRTAVQVQA